ncbi:MAG: hypothetical protein ACI9WC_001716 [Arenicella sp.]|jgi:hypothetical protein
MQSLGGRNRLDDDGVKNALFDRMQASDPSSIERITAFDMLNNMPVDNQHYAAVHDFSVNLREKLLQKYRREASHERTQWN